MCDEYMQRIMDENDPKMWEYLSTPASPDYSPEEVRTDDRT